jgi:succinyl-diaminopimelate desuccinylase
VKKSAAAITFQRFQESRPRGALLTLRRGFYAMPFQYILDRVRCNDVAEIGVRALDSVSQGHVAYPHLAINPVHLAAPLLDELAAIEWNQGNEFFPPTTFQISNIHAGTRATNIFPGELEARFSFRYSTEVTHAQLRYRVEEILDQYELNCSIEWSLSGEPFLSAAVELLDAVNSAITGLLGYRPEVNTEGGTSDGRFIAPTGAEVIELGPLNATIHKVDESVSIADLDTLSLLCQRILERLLFWSETRPTAKLISLAVSSMRRYAPPAAGGT